MDVTVGTSRDRYNFREPVTKREIKAIAADPRAKVVQTAEPARPDTWRLLDKLLLARRPDIQIRLFGVITTPVILDSLRTCQRPPLCRRLPARPCHRPRPPRGASVFTRVTFDRHVAADRPRLSRVDCSLSEVTLASRHQVEATWPRSALPLQKKQLETVYLEGQQKDIEVLSGLAELRDVTLRSISTQGLDYLKPLRKMWSLDLKLGGIRDLSAIAGMEAISYFEAWQVSRLSDVGVISELPGLQSLFSQLLANVRLLPPLSGLRKLRRIVLMNMKCLHDLTPLELAPALEEFALIEASDSQPSELDPALRNPALQRALAGFGSAKKNRLFERMREQAGLEVFNYGAPFKYEGLGA